MHANAYPSDLSAIDVRILGVSALGGCTIVVLSGPGSRSRQLQIPRGWPVWMLLVSLLSLSASLIAGRQARAWFDPNAHRPGVLAPQAPAVVKPAVIEATASSPPPRRLRSRVRPLAQALPSAVSVMPMRLSTTARDAGRTSEGARARGPSGELALFDVNGARAIRVRPFDGQGLPAPASFGQLKEFMRCRRTGQTRDMNTSLVALLATIAAHFDGAVLHVISGHRVTDEVTTRPTSQHTLGTAADIRIPGVSVERLAAAAQQLGAHGVGLYPLSRFVHVDVRSKPYFWRDVGTGAVATRAPF